MTDRRLLRAGIHGLYAITPDGLTDADLLARSEQAVAHGARVLQFRVKSAPAAPASPSGATADAGSRAALARALADACRRHGALFIVNDDPALAAVVGADGVHLGRDDTDIAAARAAWPGLLIGASCYADLKRAAAAVADGVDYIAFGSVFPSPTKPAAVRAPLTLFGQAGALGVPRVAIGGITRARCAEVRAAGADACAVITDLFGDRDTRPDQVAARAREFRLRLEAPLAASFLPSH